MALIFTLTRACLNNVNDAAGLWQIEGGKAVENNVHVADYSVVRRTSCGTEQQNTSMLWVTLFFLESSIAGVPGQQNMTLHGSHNFTTGQETGSVSAATGALVAHIGKTFTRVGNTLTVN
jgi:hypothetical protein